MFASSERGFLSTTQGGWILTRLQLANNTLVVHWGSLHLFFTIEDLDILCTE